MTINDTKHRLTALFCIAVAVAVIIMVAYETDCLVAGDFADDRFAQTEFVITAIMELLTIAAIPLALRLFKMLGNKVNDACTLWRYGALRMAMLLVPLWANTILYYLFMNATFGYMAIITLIAMAFVYPTTDRCIAETEKQ